MKTVSHQNLVDKETLKRYDDIDGLKVIEEYLLYKGTDDVGNRLFINIKLLEEMALIVYGLKSNSTNKLYVGWYLDKFYKRNNLFGKDRRLIKIPEDIFEKVDKIHAQYRTEEK